jgi:hypothetical protein
MAAGAWKVFTRAKRNMATTATPIHLNGVFRMCLCKKSASANLLKTTNTGASAWSEIVFEISARGGYVAGGRSVPAVKWTVDATSSAKMKFSFTTAGIVFTASGSALNNIKYAVIRNSTGAGAGKVLCFCTLSTTAFTISSPNTLTILPAMGGVFSLK